jgi:hypothetical protein
MSARRKVAKGVRSNLGAKHLFIPRFWVGGAAGAGGDLREMPSTLTNGLEVSGMFQRKMFHVSRIFWLCSTELIRLQRRPVSQLSSAMIQRR